MLGLPRGTVRATVLIETILAAFEMDEILFELREHRCGVVVGVFFREWCWGGCFGLLFGLEHTFAPLTPL